MKIETRITLLERIRDQHDENSWEDFYSIYRTFILYLIQRMNIPYDSTEDMLQDIMLKIWKALPNFKFEQNKGNFRGWLNTVTRNATINYIKLNKKKFGFFESDQMIKEIHAQTKPEINSIIQTEWRNFICSLAWKKIEEGFSIKAINCFKGFLSGETVKSIADDNHISEGSVYVYSKRVKDQFHREVKRLESELEG